MLPYPPKGGNLQRSYNLIRELSKYHKITILAFNQKKILGGEDKVKAAIDHFSQFCTVQHVLEIPSEKGKLPRVQLLMKSLLPWNTYTVSWLASTDYDKHLAKLLNEGDFDVVYADTISLAPYIADRKEFRKALNHHNIESQMLLRRASQEKNLLKKAYFYWEGLKLQAYERKICPKFDLNITCSEIDSERLLEITGPLDVTTIPNGVDLGYFIPTPDTPIKPKSLVFAGGLTWYPNLDAMTFFLKAVWPLLVHEIPEISLTVIGKSPPDWMVDLQKQFPTLRVTGFVDDVRPYLTEAEIYICPIKDGGGTKLKVLDALAMGKPLIADQIACEGINVEDGKTVLFASTPNEYIECIKRLLENSELRLTLSTQGQRFIYDNYSFTSIGKNLAQNLERICP